MYYITPKPWKKEKNHANMYSKAHTFAARWDISISIGFPSSSTFGFVSTAVAFFCAVVVNAKR